MKPTTVIDVQARVKKGAVGAGGGGLEGAERTSRETALWAAPIISPDRQMSSGVKETADARSQNMVQNDGYAMGALSIHRDSIVGSQYRLNARPAASVMGFTDAWAEEFSEWAETRFNLLADSTENWFDASEMNTLTGLVRLAVSGFVMTGEVLATCEWKRGLDRPFSSCIQMISPSRLSNPDGLPDDRLRRRGIEKDVFGAPRAYWIRKAHPGDLLWDVDAFEWARVEAYKPWGRRQVLHTIEQLLPDQSRGIADMTAALKQMKMTSTFQDVTLQNAVVNASYAASIESEMSPELIREMMGAGNLSYEDIVNSFMAGLSSYVEAGGTVKMDGAKIPHLYPGTKLNMKPMGTPGGVGTQFEQSLLRHIAATLGLSYEQFSRDYTNTNYSSARASMAESWKFMQSRKKLVADSTATCVYRLWLEEELNKGNVPLPRGVTPLAFLKRFYNDAVVREAIMGCDWIGASRGQIDEMKETQAAILRMNSGMSTLEMENGRLGEDWRKVLKQKAREQAYAKSLGLDLTAATNKPSTNNSSGAANATDKSETDDEL